MKKIIVILSSIFAICIFNYCKQELTVKPEVVEKKDSTSVIEEKVWEAPDTNTIPNDEFGSLIKYGRDLINNTAYYLGPDGKVGKNLGNKMNCTNCHLQAGTVPYGFNYFSTHANYPQYRGREDAVLALADRVNNCIERPHNGKPLKLDSKEMLAITSYIKWLGSGVKTNGRVKGDKGFEIQLLDRAADPEKGKYVYVAECQTCHGENGEGKMRSDNITYENPPLWGKLSYQKGSSLHRVHKLAAFIYTNMPHKKSSYLKPYLSVEDAFDVAAFINDDRIHERPSSKRLKNYPNAKSKPIDYGLGPFIDNFSEEEHKFGPWKPIIEFRKKNGLPSNF